METYWSALLLIVISILSINYLCKNFNFFKRHNVLHISPVPILGAMTSLIFRRISFGDLTRKLYNFQPDAKYFGIYIMMQPIFLLRDPEIIKDILVKNFDTFPNRQGFQDANSSLFSKNLFSLQGEKWRNVRALLSSSFTSSKMKIMFSLMSECAVDFAKFLLTLPTDKTDIDMKEAFSKYTNDVIATCAFGIKVDSMKDPMNKFYLYGKEATDFRSLKFVFLGAFPRLSQFIGLKFLRDEVENFFKDIVQTTITTRDAENITRPDMIQLMMDVRGKDDKIELNIDEMTAQAFIFFFGGFETSSTTMSFIAHEIAANPNVQTKLQQEIDQTLADFNGEITYEAINRLEYLDAVINETLRFYPSILFLERVCDKEYVLPPTLPGEKSFTMKKGMSVWIPIYAIQHDEKYYDDPEKFRPERFMGNKMHYNLSTYIPFGLGPRMCIASRFALLQIKVLLVHLLARCELKLSGKTTLPLKLSKDTFSMAAEGGFWLKVVPRCDVHPNIMSHK